MAPRYGTYNAEGMTTGDDYATAIEQAWIYTFGSDLLRAAFAGNWERQERSRAPYTDAWALPEKGITLFAGIALTHCCVEVSGEGCEILIRSDLLTRVLEMVASRVTRVDIACDIETDVLPLDFAEKRTHKRFQSDGYQNSKTGKTQYIGSKKSDRFARIYRYSKPHPRSHLLRVEHVFHKAYAKQVASEIIAKGVESVARASGLAFGWSHEVWQPDILESAIISVVHERRETGKTVFWLVSSVASAFKRLCADGTISDPQAFLQKYFLDEV